MSKFSVVVIPWEEAEICHQIIEATSSLDALEKCAVIHQYIEAYKEEGEFKFPTPLDFGSVGDYMSALLDWDIGVSVVPL